MHPQKSGFWSARAIVRAENSGERARPRALKQKERQGPVGPGIENRYQRLQKISHSPILNTKKKLQDCCHFISYGVTGITIEQWRQAQEDGAKDPFFV
jgi:hypothetical protein